MSTQVKVKFVKECSGIVQRGIPMFPMRNYMSRDNCRDKFGELSLRCDNTCDRVSIEVKEGFILDTNKQDGNNVWKTNVDVCTNVIDGQMKGTWYIRCNNRNKMNVIIHETKDVGYRAETRSFAIEVEDPEESVVHTAMAMAPATDTSCDQATNRFSIGNTNFSQMIGLGGIPVITHDDSDYIHQNITSDADATMNEEFEEFEHMDVDSMSPRTLYRFASHMKPPKLKREKNNAIYKEEGRCANETSSNANTNVSSEYSTLHEEALLVGMY